MPSAVNRSGRSLLRRVDGFRESVYICELMLLCILCVFFYLPMFKYNTVTAATTTTRSTTRMLRDRTDQEDAGDEQVVEEEEPTTATAEEESNTKSSKKKKKKKKKSRKTDDEEEEEEEMAGRSSSTKKKKKSARRRHNHRHNLSHLSPLKAPLSPIESVASPQSPMGNSVATAETAMSTPPRPEEEEDYETRLATNPPLVEPISSTTKSSRKTTTTKKNKKLADVVAAVNSSSSSRQQRRKSQPSEATLSSSTSSARQPLLGHNPSSVSFDSSSCSTNSNSSNEEEEEDGIVMKKLSHQKQRRHKKKKQLQQRYEDQQTLSTNDWFDQFMHEHGLQPHNDHSVSSSTIMSSTVPQEVVMKPSQKRLQEAFIAAYFQQSSPSMRFQEGPPAPAASSVATTTTTDGSRLRRQRKKKTKKSKGKKGLQDDHQDEEEAEEEEFKGNRVRLATETSYTTDNATPVRAAQEDDEENVLVQKLVHRTQLDDDDDADGDDEGGLIMHDDTPSDIPTVIITTPQDHDDEVQEDEDELALRHDDKKKKRRKKKKKKKHSKTTDTSTTTNSSSKKKKQQQQQQEQQVEDDGEDEEDNSHPEITVRKHIQTTLRPRRQTTSVADFENDMSDIIVPSSASTSNTTNSINNKNNDDDGVEDPRLVLSKNETFETATSSFLQEHKGGNPVGDGSDLGSSRSKRGRDVAAVEVMLAGTDTHTTATAASTSDEENHKTVTLQPDTTLLIFNYLSALADEQHKKRALDDDEKSSAKTWSSSDPASVLPSSFGSDRPEDDDDDDDDDSTIAPFKITNSNSSDPTHMVLDQVLLFDKSTKKTGDSQEDKNDNAMDTTNNHKGEPSVSTIEAATVPQAIGEQQATIEVPATTTTKVFSSLSSSTTARTSSPADQAVLAMILNDQADITDPAVNPVLELLRDDGDLTLSQIDDRNDVIARLLDEELQTPTSSRDGTDGPPKPAEVAAVKEHIANIPGVQTFQPTKQGRGRAFVDSIRLFFLGGSTAQQESNVFDVTPPATAAKDSSVLQPPFATTTSPDATVGGARGLPLLEGEAEEANVIMNTAKSNGSDSGVLITAESAVAEPQRVEHISPRGGYLPCCVVHSDGGFELEITSRFNRLFEANEDEPEQQLKALSAAEVVGEEAAALPPPTSEPKAPAVEETKEETEDTEDLNEIVDRIVEIQASTEDDDEDDACTLYSVSSCYFEDIEAYATTQSSVALEVVKKDERNVVFLVRGKTDDVSLSSDRQLVKMMESNASWLSRDDDSADEANSILAVDVNEKKESGQEERETPATPSSLLQGYDTLIKKLLFGSPEPKEEFTAKDHGEIQNALKKDAMQLVEMAEPNSTPDIDPRPDQKDEPKLAAAPVLSKQEDDAAEDQPARDTPSAPAISGQASVPTPVPEAAHSQISKSESPQLGGAGSRTTDGSDCKQESFKGSFDGVFLAPLDNIEGFLSSKEDENASSKEAFWIAVPQAEKYVRDQVGEPSDPAQNLSNINDILASSDDDSSAGISKSSGGEIAYPWTSSVFTTELLSNNEVGAAAEVEVHVALDDTPYEAAQQDSKDRELVPNAEAEPETQLTGNNSHEDETSETAKSSPEVPETVLSEETAESNHEALETLLKEESSETQSAHLMEACSTLTDSNESIPSDDDSEYSDEHSDEHSVGAIIAISASVEVAIGEEEDGAVQFVHHLEAHATTNDDAEAEVEADQIDALNSSQTEDIQDGVLNETSPSEADASDDGSDAWSDISESEETVEYVEEAEEVAEGEDIFGYTAVAVVAEASDAEHMNDEVCEGEVRADASSVSMPVNREFEFEASREEQVDGVVTIDAIDTVSEVANDDEACEIEREGITDTTEPMLDTVDSEKKNVFIDEESQREARESVSSSADSSQEEEVVTVGNNSEPVSTDENSNAELGEESDVGNEELASTKSSSEDDMLLCVDATGPNLELDVADERDAADVLETEQPTAEEKSPSTNATISQEEEVLGTEQTTAEEKIHSSNAINWQEEVLETEQTTEEETVPAANSQELVEEDASNDTINSQEEVLETEQTTEEETVPATNSQELVEEDASDNTITSQEVLETEQTTEEETVPEDASDDTITSQEVLETEQTTEEETVPATNSQELVEEDASDNTITSQEEVLETEQTTEEETIPATNSQEFDEEGEHEGDASQADEAEGEENPTEPAFNKLDFLFASQDEDDDDDAWETDTDGEYVDDFLSESLPDGDLVSDQEMNSTKSDDGWETESEIASPRHAPINAWHVEHFKTEDDQLDVDETQDDELPRQEAPEHILDSAGSIPQNSSSLVVDTTNEDEWETDSEIVTPRPESAGATKMLFALEDEEDEVQVADCGGLSDHGADEAAVMVTEEMPSVQVKTTIPAPDAAEGDEVDEEDNNLDTEPSVPVEAVEVSSSDGSQSQDAEGQKESTNVQEVVEVAVSDDASCSTIESTKEEEIVDSVHKDTDGQEVLAGEAQPEETTPTQAIQTESVISETINAIADTPIAEDCHPLGDEPDDTNVETEIVFQRSWGSSSQNHQEEQAEEKAMHLANLLAAVGSDDTATEKKEDDVSFEEISEIAGEELRDEFYKMETASALQAAIGENRAEARGQNPWENTKPAAAAKSTLGELDDFYRQLMAPESGHEAMRSSKPSSIAFPPRARTLKEHIEHWDLARALAELTMVRQELESMKRILQTKAAALEIAEQELRDQGQVIARVELEKALLVADLCHATATPASFRAAILGTTSNQQNAFAGSESEV